MMRDCPYCESMSSRLILKNQWVAPTRGSFQNGYNVVECLSCGGVYADGIPDAKTVNDYYAAQSKKAQGYKANNWEEPDGWIDIHRSTKEWIMDNAVPGPSILDVGCFTGNLMSMFTGVGEVFGYDPSRMGHEVAKLKYGFDTEIASRFKDTRFYREGKNFSLIIMSHVVEHIVDVDSFFADIRPALRDGGKLYIEVPDITHWFLSEDLRYCITQREPMLQLNAEHINFFSPSSLDRMMSRFGYCRLACESRGRGMAVISSLWGLRPERKKLGDAKYVIDYFQKSMEVYDRLNAIMRSVKGPVYVWGAGGHTQRMMQYSEMRGMPIEAFIESNADYYGGMLAGRLIINPSEISLPYPIIVSSLMYQSAIMAQIKKMGIKNRVITLY